MNFTQNPLRSTYKYFTNGEIDYIGSGFVSQNEDIKFPPFEFEKIDWIKWAKFTQANWHIPIFTGIIYISLIFGLQYYMRNRKPFDLNTALFFWNASLGIYSFVGFTRLIMPFLNNIFANGLYSTCCVVDFNMPMIFWHFTFLVSKFVELGDTVFIVLRKKPLQFIQWYHHIITLSLVWTTFGFLEPLQYYFGILNLGVHSLMYPYFAMKALDIKVPREIATIITSAQFTQMIIAFVINAYTTYLYYSGAAPCLRHPSSIKSFAFVYGTFVVLFGKLYYDLVIASNKRGIKKE